MTKWQEYVLGGVMLCSMFGTAYLSTILGSTQVILSAMPFFFFMMLVEFLLCSLTNINKSVGSSYAIVDVWASLGAGLSQLVIGTHLLVQPLQLDLGPFAHIYENYPLLGFQFTTSSTHGWLLFFFAYDFCYYWLHRCGHTIGFLWAGHSVHHSSERYNLSTALRQSWWQTVFGFVFYLPLATVFPPIMLLIHRQWNAVFQFWVHTCVVRSMPDWFEFLFMTPAHHRIHHDRRYHKNFAGVLVLWDRLFGSFLDERQGGPKGGPDKEELEVFGTAQTITSWIDPIVQYQSWVGMWKQGRLLRGPGWFTVVANRRFGRPRSLPLLRLHTQAPASTRMYIAAHMFLINIPQLAVYFIVKPIALSATLGLAMYTLGGLLSHGLMFDGNVGVGATVDLVRMLFTLFAISFDVVPNAFQNHTSVVQPIVQLTYISALASMPCLCYILLHKDAKKVQ